LIIGPNLVSDNAFTQDHEELTPITERLAAEALPALVSLKQTHVQDEEKR